MTHARRRPAALLGAAALVVLLALGGAGCGGTGGDPAATSTTTTSGAPAVPAQLLGINANTLGGGTRAGFYQSSVRHTGIRWLREEPSWSLIEPRRGERRWAAADHLMITAAHRHMRMLILLHGTPEWAKRPAGGLPTATAAYAAYVRDVVTRYGPHGTFWRLHPRLSRASIPHWFELWNEPFLAPPVRGVLDASRYAALADAGLRAGQAADPDARFLLSADVSWTGDAPTGDRWIDRLDRSVPGLLDRADGVSAHPYGDDPGIGLNAVDDLRSSLLTRGHDLPIWITEIGWSTCSGGERDACVSEKRQAANLKQFLTGMRMRSAAVFPAVFVYSFTDLLGGDASRESRFGIIHLDGSHKPSWSTVSAFARSR